MRKREGAWAWWLCLPRAPITHILAVHRHQGSNPFMPIAQSRVTGKAGVTARGSNEGRLTVGFPQPQRAASLRQTGKYRRQKPNHPSNPNID